MHGVIRSMTATISRYNRENSPAQGKIHGKYTRQDCWICTGTFAENIMAFCNIYSCIKHTSWCPDKATLQSVASSFIQDILYKLLLYKTSCLRNTKEMEGI